MQYMIQQHQQLVYMVVVLHLVQQGLVKIGFQEKGVVVVNVLHPLGIHIILVELVVMVQEVEAVVVVVLPDLPLIYPFHKQQ